LEPKSVIPLSSICCYFSSRLSYREDPPSDESSIFRSRWTKKVP
jgi:hypothetical protein